MSCKILPQADQRVPERLYWKELHSEQSSSPIRNTQTPGAAQDSSELRKMHSRIAELESAMESQLRQAHARGIEEGHSPAKGRVTSPLAH